MVSRPGFVACLILLMAALGGHQILPIIFQNFKIERAFAPLRRLSVETHRQEAARNAYGFHHLKKVGDCADIRNGAKEDDDK